MGPVAAQPRQQLRDFQEGRRSDPVMSPMAAGLTRDEARDLADWFAKQKR